jgi:hypothetical protein
MNPENMCYQPFDYQQCGQSYIKLLHVRLQPIWLFFWRLRGG